MKDTRLRIRHSAVLAVACIHFVNAQQIRLSISSDHSTHQVARPIDIYSIYLHSIFKLRPHSSDNSSSSSHIPDSENKATLQVKMPRRRRTAEEDDFKPYEEVIRQLYISENRPLHKVISMMAEDHGFNRRQVFVIHRTTTIGGLNIHSKAQYESAFRRWGIKKNSKADEWKFVGQRIEEREYRGLRCAVKIRGVQIPEAKVLKEVQRYKFQTTYDRCANSES